MALARIAEQLEALWSPKPKKPTLPQYEALEARVQEERNKRFRADGAKQYLQAEGELDDFRKDIFGTPFQRDPVNAEVKVLVVGGGFAGMLSGVDMRKAGVEDFVIVEKGSDFGGVWYWNRYPGIKCDVESLLYLPLLEDTGYIPKRRYEFGHDIRKQIKLIDEKFRLREKAYFQTEIKSIAWDESISRWHVYTNRKDHFIAQFVTIATGFLHMPKLPAIPGIGKFRGDQFHSARFNYDITGGSPVNRLTKLSKRKVGIIGTGASAVQLLKSVATDAEKVYVFQRTPCSVILRENHEIDQEELKQRKSGWQREYLELYAKIVNGQDIDDECTALEGFDITSVRELKKRAKLSGIEYKEENIAAIRHANNVEFMNSIRKSVEDNVIDKETAEKLKPWFNFFCKRPAFDNDYYNAFNLPHVELVDTDGKGVERITENSVVVDGQEYECDLLIHCSGFYFELGASFEQRTGIHILGKKGQTLDEKFASNVPPGPSTYYGVHIRDFPNLMMISTAQTARLPNHMHLIQIMSEHIAQSIKLRLNQKDYQAMEPSLEAEKWYSEQVAKDSAWRVKFFNECTPGSYNAEGHEADLHVRWGAYPVGVVEFTKELKDWREGGFEGMENW